uniref:Uncharacterized protein n=1 Tax=Glossina palpalis gambiensis TaxID=67801 RepID=A0A1B0C7Q4_9MUSC
MQVTHCQKKSKLFLMKQTQRHKYDDEIDQPKRIESINKRSLIGELPEHLNDDDLLRTDRMAEMMPCNKPIILLCNHHIRTLCMCYYKKEANDKLNIYPVVRGIETTYRV